MVLDERRKPGENPQQTELDRTISQYKQSEEFLALSDNSRMAYSGDLAQFQRFVAKVDVTRIQELTPQHVADFFIYLHLTGLTPSTIERKKTSLSNLINFIQRDEPAGQNLKKGIPFFQRHESSSRQTASLTTEQQSSLINSISNQRDGVIVSLILQTGLRIGEVVALNAEDIQETAEGKYAVVIHGNHSRVLDLSEGLSNEILDYIEGNKIKEDEALIRRITSTRKLTEKRLSRQGVWLILKTYGDKIAVDLSPTALRETFIKNFKGTPRELDIALGRQTLSKSQLTDAENIEGQLEVKNMLNQTLARRGQIFPTTTPQIP
ncbi:MAG: tyrosine-type recombinase/integrase [bacterium]|nr:tyrosine-type recombinase/integrase [bacterium]